MSVIACLDLEGVLIPEIWIEFSNKTGIEELQATTRDISDYSELMRNLTGGRTKTLRIAKEIKDNIKQQDS